MKRNLFNPDALSLTKFLFFTGKGGVGKTSLACATAVHLADAGKRVLLVSTDPASNLQDVFSMELDGSAQEIPGARGLLVVNLDPLQAAEEYRESVVGPYRGKLPDSVIQNMEEQLSGSCTVEIASFNAFADYLTDEEERETYDYILFDTAPTGHTLRMLQLPAAWSGFIRDSTYGASCLGQLSGLEERKDVYQKAVDTLTNPDQTTLILVTRPEETPLKEAARASAELEQIGMRRQLLVVNGCLQHFGDAVSDTIRDKQKHALEQMPQKLKELPVYYMPLRSYNITGLSHLRLLFTTDEPEEEEERLMGSVPVRLQKVIDDLYVQHKKVIFTMGKGGVGKTTVAAAIALGLAEKGEQVHLATTDPAAHIGYVIHESSGITMSCIDEKKELKRYQDEVLAKAQETMSDEDLAYIEEDLRSPCTQEIAVFRAFAEIIAQAEQETVVVDTAPTGHTLLLLDSTQSYAKEVQRTQGGDIPESVVKLLPRLRSQETEVLIVTLAEATPVLEAERLEQDLNRAGISAGWWIINSSFYGVESQNPLLQAKAEHEVHWMNRIQKHAGSHTVLLPWCAEEVKGERLHELF